MSLKGGVTYTASRKDWKGEDGLSLVGFEICPCVKVRTLFIVCVTLPNNIVAEGGRAKWSVKPTQTVLVQIILMCFKEEN